MSSETASARVLQGMDSPWHRLPWTLPAALLIWAAALWGLAYFMGKPTQRPAEPPPIEAQLLEQYYPTQSTNPGPPAAVVQPQPAPQVRPQPVPEKPKPIHRAKKKPEPPEEAVAPVAIPVAPAGARGLPGAGPATAKVKPAANNYGSQGGSYGGKGPPQGNMYGSSGARAILHPMPHIPEDLRAEAFNSEALVRFQVAVDGSVEVELVQPTANPLLNRILLDTLKKWRFMPAIKGGKPVATTEEVRVKIEVK